MVKGFVSYDLLFVFLASLDNEYSVARSLYDLIQLINMNFRFLYLANVINPSYQMSEITVHIHNAEDQHLHVPLFLIAGEVKLQMDVVEDKCESQEDVIEVCFY